MSYEVTGERLRGRKPSWHRSLPVRLTFYYGVVLLAALGVCYAVSYWRISSLVADRVDAYLSTESDECHHFYDMKGLPAVIQEANAESQAEGSRDVYFRVIDDSGKTVFETSSALAKGLPEGAGKTMRKPYSVTEEVQWPARIMVMPLSPKLSLMIVASMESDFRLVSKSMSLILMVMAGTWICACVLGIGMTRRYLRGITVVTEAAIAIAEGDIGRRVPHARGGNEIDRLAEAFNTMAQRIERLLGNLRETNDSLAHELRSPLTRMRSRCELAMLHGRVDPQPQALAQDQIEQIDELLGTINAILDMSAYQAGVSGAAVLPVDLRKVLADACDLFLPVAEDGRVTLELEAPETLPVAGNCNQLQRMFSNLLDNALKYTLAGGRVTVQGHSRQGRVEVVVADTGVGIAADELPKVFKRFFRGRNGLKHAGNGLGLSLAQIIAVAHGGLIHVESRPHLGTTFTVELPLLTGKGSSSDAPRWRPAAHADNV